MAPRPDQDLEIFTDLNGAPEKGEAADAALLDDSKLGKTGTKKEGEDEEDDDLAIVDEAEEGEEAGTAEEEEEAEEEGESGEEEETAAPVVAADPEILFNPADVNLIIEKSNNLEFREKAENTALERAKTDAADAKAAMEKAMEDGDSKAHGAATERFADAKAAFMTATNKLENIGIEKGNLAAQAKAVIAKAPKNDKGESIVDKIVFAKPAAGAAPAKEGKGSKLAAKFTELNPWFNDPKKAGQRAVLLGIDQAMATEKKLDKNSPAWFTELGKRFNKLHPGVFKDLDGKLIATGARQRGAGNPVPGGGGGGADRQPASGKIRLTSADVEQMRVFQMDPNDPKVRRAWLNEKISNAAADARRGKAA